jgi:hypothetical protein
LLHYPRRLNPAVVNSSGDHDGRSDTQVTQSYVREMQTAHGNNNNSSNNNNNNNDNNNHFKIIQKIPEQHTGKAQK